MQATAALPSTAFANAGADKRFLFRMLCGNRREILFWALHSLYWLAIGLLGWVMVRAFKSAVPDADATLAVRMASGFVLSAGLRGIYAQPWLRRMSPRGKWPLVAACCVAVALLEALTLKLLLRADIAVPGGAEMAGSGLLLVRIFIMGLWSALYFGVHLVEDEHALELRATRAELTAKDYELRHLQARMNPHFVFHTLDGVLACRTDPKAVEEVTRGLSDYLAFLLRETDDLVPLGRELEALEKFLTVQATHISKKLVCHINWDSAARSALVPPMIIQPLVENAFLHRPADNDLPLQIWLTASLESGLLHITLSNTGQPAPVAGRLLVDDGIDALRKRLNLLLGSEARVKRQAEDGWIRVSVIVPVTGREKTRGSQIPRSAP